MGRKFKGFLCSVLMISLLGNGLFLGNVFAEDTAVMKKAKSAVTLNVGKEEKFQKADTDKDGYISVQEYIKMMVSNYEETIKELESI